MASELSSLTQSLTTKSIFFQGPLIFAAVNLLSLLNFTLSLPISLWKRRPASCRRRPLLPSITLPLTSMVSSPAATSTVSHCDRRSISISPLRPLPSPLAIFPSTIPLSLSQPSCHPPSLSPSPPVFLPPTIYIPLQSTSLSRSHHTVIPPPLPLPIVLFSGSDSFVMVIFKLSICEILVMILLNLKQKDACFYSFSFLQIRSEMDVFN